MTEQELYNEYRKSDCKSFTDFLINKIAELKKGCDETQGLLDKQIEATYKLDKENAELKEKVNILDNCDRLGDVITEAYKEQLTKAKEIISAFVEWANWEGGKCPSFKSIQDKAEQFLKGIENE